MYERWLTLPKDLVIEKLMMMDNLPILTITMDIYRIFNIVIRPHNRILLEAATFNNDIYIHILKCISDVSEMYSQLLNYI